jgi:predicted regulator of Ras-like GTPase activity (Roadblock/LC7/MglB family)
MGMAFREIIEQMHRFDPSIRGGALAGTDGLTVEEWCAEDGAVDLPALCAEMGQFFKESGRIARENGMGETEELTLATSGGLLFLYKVTEEYFFLVVTESGAIPGKWRFLLRQGARRAREAL